MAIRANIEEAWNRNWCSKTMDARCMINKYDESHSFNCDSLNVNEALWVNTEMVFMADEIWENTERPAGSTSSYRSLLSPWFWSKTAFELFLLENLTASKEFILIFQLVCRISLNADFVLQIFHLIRLF